MNTNEKLFKLEADLVLLGRVKRLIYIARMSFGRTYTVPVELRETLSEYREEQDLQIRERGDSHEAMLRFLNRKKGE